MINKKISIGTVQFAINTEESSHLLAEHPIGSISRMFSELLSENLSFLEVHSDTASLIISKPEENTTKQLIYTSMLPIETARKIFDSEYYDYLIFGELKFENILKVEITLINRLNDKSIRRELSIKNNNLFILSVNIINEVFKLIDLDISIDKLKDILKYSVDDLKSWGWYSLSYEKDLDNSDKILSLEKSIEYSPKFDLAKVKLFILKFEEDNKFNLEESLKEVDFELINYFANQYESKKEFFIAFNLYKTSYNKSQSQSNILSKLIKLSYENKYLEDFNNYISIYINTINKNDFNYEEIPFYIYLSGQENLAIDKLLDGIKLNNNSSKMYSTLAYIYMNKNDLENASKYYQKSFDLYKNVNILEDLTSILIKKKEFEQVIETINNSIDDLPSNSGVLCNLAISYLALDNEEQAIKVLEKAIKFDKNNSNVNSLLGNIYLDKKSFSRSQKYFFLALQNEPNNPIWNINMGNLFFEQNDFEEANKYYDKARETNKNLNIPKKLICDAFSLEKDNKYQEAINIYIKASKFLPEMFLPIQRIVEIFIKEEQINEAMDILEKNSEKFKDEIILWDMLYKVYKTKEKGLFKNKWKQRADNALSKLNNLKK
jgi:tetratricopeptide (TPR) repeat protein